jgi:hypothetical protein
MYYNVMSFPQGSYIASCNLYQPPYYYEISTNLHHLQFPMELFRWVIHYFQSYGVMSEAFLGSIGEPSVIFFKRMSNWKFNWVSNMSNEIQWHVDT